MRFLILTVVNLWPAFGVAAWIVLTEVVAQRLEEQRQSEAVRAQVPQTPLEVATEEQGS